PSDAPRLRRGMDLHRGGLHARACELGSPLLARQRGAADRDLGAVPKRAADRTLRAGDNDDRSARSARGRRVQARSRDRATGGLMLEIRELVKTFRPARSQKREPVVAVDGLSLEVERGELFTLLGPSGCGKTTTLRCIAGLETPDSGEIEVGDRLLFSSEKRVRLPASERGLGMVFQSYAIWPHMNVYKNAAFPLEVLPRRKRPSRKARRDRVERALAVVRLDQLASRPATDLSGGQQQRLALARALVMEPSLLLLD